MDRVKKALEWAIIAHKGQKDKGGHDYILHPMAVSSKVSSDDEKIVALLHDVLEDTKAFSADDIEREFGKKVKNGVLAMTKREGEDYFDFVRRAAKDPIAHNVKLADISHNMDLTRLENVTQKDLLRVEKYKKAISIINSTKIED